MDAKVVICNYDSESKSSVMLKLRGSVKYQVTLVATLASFLVGIQPIDGPAQ